MDAVCKDELDVVPVTLRLSVPELDTAVVLDTGGEEPEVFCLLCRKCGVCASRGIYFCNGTCRSRVSGFLDESEVRMSEEDCSQRFKMTLSQKMKALTTLHWQSKMLDQVEITTSLSCAKDKCTHRCSPSRDLRATSPSRYSRELTRCGRRNFLAPYVQNSGTSQALKLSFICPTLSTCQS